MNSIQQKSMVILASVSLFIMVIVFTGSYLTAANYFKDDLTQKMAHSDEALSVVMQEAIFSYDAGLAKNILASFTKYAYIHEITAVDHRGKLIGTAKEQSQTPPVAAVLTNHEVKVFWEDGKEIGHLTITYRQDATDQVLSTTKWMFFSVGILLLISLMLTNWAVLTRLVLNPVQKITFAMAEIARGEGDLTQRLALKTNDEIGQLTEHFNAFVDNMHGLITRIVQHANQLSDNASAIQASASDNAKSTERQLLEIEQATTALNQMSSTTQEVANNASQTAEKTHTCNELALKGNQIVQKTVDEIHALGEKITLTSDTIHALKEKSEHINTVLEVIKNIAEQTNLLALNAAIESARAGEQGRGFAVVADEVRALAQRTHVSTEEIEGTIQDLQQTSESAGTQMAMTRETLEATIEESGQAIDALREIIEDINQINDMNTQIATAAEQQTVVANDINEKVFEINHLTADVTTKAGHVGHLSDQLEALSATIKADLAKFKI